MKIAAAEFANSRGQREARVQGIGMGLAPTQWRGIKNPSGLAGLRRVRYSQTDSITDFLTQA